MALSLPRTEERVVRDHVTFRVGRIVYLAFSRDEQTMGIAFPREERAALVEARPSVFFLPRASDMRFNWVGARPAELGHREACELVIDAWRMAVPKRVAAEHLALLAEGTGTGA